MIFFKEQFMEKKNKIRWAFDSYKQEQGAIHKLVHTLLDGVKDKTNVVVAWGDGSFGPTSRGHASAPNKGLMERIARFLPVVLVDEFRTSKVSSCCEVEMVERRTSSYKKRATVLSCTKCKGIVNACTHEIRMLRSNT